jgi:hypothetical protein
MNPVERRKVEIATRGSRLTGDQPLRTRSRTSRGASISPGAESIPSGSLKLTLPTTIVPSRSMSTSRPGPGVAFVRLPSKEAYPRLEHGRDNVGSGDRVRQWVRFAKVKML